MSSSWRARVEPIVLETLREGARSTGRPVPTLASRPFEDGLLDSVQYVSLVEAVERALDVEIDGLEIDPDALDTVDGLVSELAGAVMED